MVVSGVSVLRFVIVVRKGETEVFVKDAVVRAAEVPRDQGAVSAVHGPIKNHRVDPLEVINGI